MHCVRLPTPTDVQYQFRYASSIKWPYNAMLFISMFFCWGLHHFSNGFLWIGCSQRRAGATAAAVMGTSFMWISVMTFIKNKNCVFDQADWGRHRRRLRRRLLYYIFVDVVCALCMSWLWSWSVHTNENSKNEQNCYHIIVSCSCERTRTPTTHTHTRRHKFVCQSIRRQYHKLKWLTFFFFHSLHLLFGFLLLRFFLLLLFLLVQLHILLLLLLLFANDQRGTQFGRDFVTSAVYARQL